MNIIDFSESPHERYLPVTRLSEHRSAEIATQYLLPLDKRHDDNRIVVMELRQQMADSVDELAIRYGDDHLIVRQWRRCCHGIDCHLLTSSVQRTKDRRTAAEVVARLSAYQTPIADIICMNLWGYRIPNLKTGGPISFWPDAPDCLTIWNLLDTNKRTDYEKRYCASRLINFMADRMLVGAETAERAYESLLKTAGVFNNFDVNSPNVDFVARVVQISRTTLEDVMRQDFDPSTTYNPSSAQRRKWFENLRRIPSPVVYERAFIKLTLVPEDAKRELERIAETVSNQALVNFIANSWEVDDNGFLRSQLVLRLFRFASKCHELRQWFDSSLVNSYGDISYDAISGALNEGQVQDMILRKDNIETAFSSFLRSCQTEGQS